MTVITRPMVYRLENVTKYLEKGGTKFTLRVPELTVRRGELIAFVGASGCGKTTLFDLLGLISRPTSADRFDLQFDESISPVTLPSSERWLAGFRRQNIGYVLQDGGLLPFLTVAENIHLPLWTNRLDRPESVDLLAHELGIAGQWQKKPAFLSSGQRQRVAIARALVHSPSVVLADEPTGAVDSVTAREIRDLLRKAAHSRGATILLVTHDEPLMTGVTDRVFSFSVEKTAGDAVESTLFETTWKSLENVAS